MKEFRKDDTDSDEESNFGQFKHLCLLWYWILILGICKDQAGSKEILPGNTQVSGKKPGRRVNIEKCDANSLEGGPF